MSIHPNCYNYAAKLYQVHIGHIPSYPGCLETSRMLNFCSGRGISENYSLLDSYNVVYASFQASDSASK